MSNQHKRDVKLTLADLIAAKATKEAQRSVTADVYIASLGGCITVYRPERKVLYKAGDLAGETMAEKMYSNAYLVYNSCKSLQTTDLQEAYGVSDPIDIVYALLDPIEINDAAEKIMEISGFTRVEEEVKN